MRKLGSIAAGLFLGAAMPLLAAGCPFAGVCDGITDEMPFGAYAEQPVGSLPRVAEIDYRFERLAGDRARESYTRGGKRYVIEYRTITR